VFGSVGYYISDEAICDAVRLVAELIGHSPRLREYVEEREKVIEESLDAGDPKTLPSPSLIQRRYGVWDAALTCGGRRVAAPAGTEHFDRRARAAQGFLGPSSDADALRLHDVVTVVDLKDGGCWARRLRIC